MCRAPARPVCACFVRSCCRVVVQEHDLRDHVAMQRQANLFFRLHTALFSPRTSHFALHTSCTSPFTLHSSCSTPHFITTHLISALPIPLWRPRLHTTNFYTQQAFTQRSFYTQKAFTHSKLLHREAFAHSKLLHSKLLHTESFLHTASLYTQQAFTQRGFLLHTEIAKRKKNVFEALFDFNAIHAAPAAHRRLHTEKHQVSCSGFLPKTSPGQQSCSHYNAFCSNTWQTRISLRTWQQDMTRISHHPK